MKWTNDIVIRLESAAEDLDVLSTARLEMLLREAIRTIRSLRTSDVDADMEEADVFAGR